MKTYEPTIETARLAPACVCNVASRVVWLRQKAKTFPENLQRELAPFLAPLPFEKELLSGIMESVDRAIQETGKPLV